MLHNPVVPDDMGQSLYVVVDSLEEKEIRYDMLSYNICFVFLWRALNDWVKQNQERNSCWNAMMNDMMHVCSVRGVSGARFEVRSALFNSQTAHAAKEIEQEQIYIRYHTHWNYE